MKILKFAAMAGLVFGVATCAHNVPTPTPTPTSPPAPAQSAVTPARDGQALADAITEYTESAKRLDAFFAPYFNVEEDLDKFGDYPSPAYFQRAKRIYQAALDRLDHINSAALTPKELLSYRLFKEDMQVSMRRFEFPTELLAFNQMDNRLHDYMDDSSRQLTQFPFDTVKHYDAFIKRSEEFPNYVDAQIALLRRGIDEGITLGCTVAAVTPNTYRGALESRIQKNPFWRPMTFMPASFGPQDRARLKKEFGAMIRERIVPGYRKLDRFFRKEYLPHCRTGFGLTDLPNGKEWYRFSILASTGLQLDPKELHETGLKEVARISAELERIKDSLGDRRSLKDFLRSLAKDPKYFFHSQAELMASFMKVKAETAAKIPKFFSLIPKTEYEIVNTSNPEAPGGEYDPPTENIPHGRFIVNALNLHAVPTYELTTLLMHEAVPGHHFQMALQFEMKEELSEYQRKLFSSNAFGEGWALYSEYLGNEMGMYTDPLQRVGNLNDDMLRAVRLVVDTGIHELGWSREKALAYMTDHLASDSKDMSNEVNRYSVWPGQALGYKVGQLKIIELRKRAESALGPKFDLREFHRAVIGNGSVSLGVLESQVDEWIRKSAI